MCFTCIGHLARLLSSSVVRGHTMPCAYVNAAFAFSRTLRNIAAEAYGEVRASCVTEERMVRQA
jgi:hypothetical protein